MPRTTHATRTPSRRPGPRATSALALAAVTLLAAGSASAELFNLVGARYQGMGGAGVAVAEDSLAIYWNPGAMPFQDSWGVNFGVGGNASVEGNVIELLDETINDWDALGSTLDDVQAGNSLTSGQVQDLIDFAVNGLPALDTRGSGIAVSADAELMGRFRGWGLSAMSLANAGVQPVVDDLNLGLSVGANAVDNVVGSGMDRSGQFSNDPSSQSLADAIAASTTYWTQDQAEELVWQSEQAGVNTSKQRSRDMLTSMAETTGAGIGNPGINLDANDSGVFTRGIITNEFALTYGHAFFDKKLGFGGNIKYIYGVTFNSFLRYDDYDNVGDALDDLFDDGNSKRSSNFGLDLGLKYKATDWLDLGLVARNVNAPSFDAARDPNVPLANQNFILEPQVRAGLALYPLKRWILALDIDVLENNSTNIIGLEQRMISFGTEYRIPIGGSFDLALRTGLWTNLSHRPSDSLAWTGGLGIRWGGFHLDAAVGSALSSTDIETDVGTTKSFPNRLNAALQLQWVHHF
ncbi:MAG: conjugal transfer protein TraF [Deltaproteobacteria bacterium]|nr:conjugal transfer protein TraF [Deltaproteobacteria bacterium]MBW2420946.1 conjugal transfer protein TraF [Deltaproteobacteria bacterium]